MNADQLTNIMQTMQNQCTQMQEQMKQMTVMQGENLELQARNKVLEAQSKQPDTIKRSPPKRPTIEANMDDADWSLFLDSWDRYTKMTKLTSREVIILELRAACSNDVNKLLFEFVGAETLNSANLTTDGLIAHIKSVAVKGVHKEVHRMIFGKMNQSTGESITHFVARLRSQSLLCEFSVDCPCNTKVSFAEEMVSQRLVAGLRNQEHQSRVLGEAATLPKLQQKIDRLISLETTEEATSSLGGSPTTAAAVKSGHKKTTQFPQRYGDPTKNPPRFPPRNPSRFPPRSSGPPRSPRPQPMGPCRGCGKSTHGEGKTLYRSDCPFYDHTCTHCRLVGHDSAYCERLRTSKARSTESYDAAQVSSSFVFGTDFRPSQQRRPPP